MDRKAGNRISPARHGVEFYSRDRSDDPLCLWDRFRPPFFLLPNSDSSVGFLLLGMHQCFFLETIGGSDDFF